jgi:hypothetical protein
MDGIRQQYTYSLLAAIYLKCRIYENIKTMHVIAKLFNK